MALNKRMVYIFVLFLSLPTPIATAYCKQRHTNRPLNGFRCNGQPFTSPQAYKPGENWNTYIAHNGNQIVSRNEDLLTAHPNCTVAWVPYKAGGVLPMNAIVTGMLTNGRRLYSSLSRHKPAGYLRVSSYAEGDTAAYYAHGGSNAVTEFDVLISV